MSKYIVYIGETPITRLNENLIKRQRLSDSDVERIKFLHQGKYTILQRAKEHQADKYMLRMFAKMITEIEFELQRSWQFPMDVNYHRFWELPGCTCPRMDNEDSYGTSHHVIDGSCPVHGQRE